MSSCSVDNSKVMFQILFLISLIVWTVQASAQSLGTTDTLESSPASVADQIRQTVPQQSTNTDVTQPFGANLFAGGFSSERENGLTPDYLIVPGDQINVSIWGAFAYNDVATVDPQGNIFIPNVGPVQVGGVSNSELNNRVLTSVRTVFTDNVNVYTSLIGTNPIAVFVTGYVNQPGRFAGIPANSPLFFLDKAQGIDPDKGSYRHVKVLRDEQTVVDIDLYRFLTEGFIPSIQFKDGDIIHVEPRGAAVTVTGDVRNQAKFELLGESISGSELYKMVLPRIGVSYVGISGVRNSVPFSRYIRLEEFSSIELLNGDELSFSADNKDEVIVVDIEGSFFGPSKFVVPKNTKLTQLLDFIAVDAELTDTSAISIKRKSIAEKQKASLESSLQRLEARYLTAGSQTTAEASIRTQEAQRISEFVARARQVEPNGRLVVSENGNYADIILQSGDVINIPERNESVLLSGEVLVAQALLYNKRYRAVDYINRSGGFSTQADRKKIVLIHANGEVSSIEGSAVRPGDEIIVLPKVPVKNLQTASVIVDILYKIAIAASVAVRL